VKSTKNEKIIYIVKKYMRLSFKLKNLVKKWYNYRRVFVDKERFIDEEEFSGV
jgi:hypothetical protein